MFRTKKVQEFSFPRISKKLQNDRESIQRIKHLRTIIDNIHHNELKAFFQKNYSLIFNAFYDVFMNVQMDLQQKVNSSHYKELQNILGVFEKILILLPELINRKWQFNCISAIIRTLIHPNNTLKVRLQGLQLFIIWFQILNDNAPKVCYDIYTSLVPIFESLIKKIIYPDLNMDNQPNTHVNSIEVSIFISEIEIKPVLTQNIDKELDVDDEDQYLLRYLLRYMVTESIKIEWEENSHEKRLSSQTFLIDKFKEYLLPVIFPKCNSDYTIEKNRDTPLVTSDFLYSYSPVFPKYPIEMGKICCYQEEVIRWLTELVNIDHPSLTRVNSDIFPKPKEISEENKRENCNSMKSNSGQTKPSTNSNVFVKFDKDNLKMERSMLQQMHQILFKNEENVNIINQLCQHAFYLPLQFHKTHLSVIYVYKSWLFSSHKHPSFMMDNENSSPINFKSLTVFNDLNTEASPKVKISVTMQRVIFTNLGTIFMHKYKNELVGIRSSPNKKQQLNIIQFHSDLVKNIIASIYRPSVYSISNLENEHLMNVLLDISFNVLNSYSPSNRPENHWISFDTTIEQFFQTLNVLMLKSNLVSYISDEIWEQYLKVYSSLTDWVPMISEWKKTLYLILKMCGKILYNVDITDLPLDKKEKRGRRIKKTTISKQSKKTSLNEENIMLGNDTQEINKNVFKNNTMNAILNFQPNTSFMEGLNQNTDDTILCCPEQRNNINTKSDNKEVIPIESTEVEAGSFADSSHEETSSYMSAEDSSSPHCKDKNIEASTGHHSDSEFIQLSSSGGDTSAEGNSSFDTSIKPIYKDESEDIDIDADDESEGEAIDNIYFEVDSKSATLTRDESDVDITSQLYRLSNQDSLNDSSRTPTKQHTSRRKNQQSKRLDRNSMTIEENIVNAISDPQDLSNQIFTSENINDHHVLLGGIATGWSQESVVLIWKRFIGLLGNVTMIKDKKNILSIFEYFSEITNLFLKIRENMCVPNDNQVTPKPPLYTPPIEYIIPWMFQLLLQETATETVKLIALKILCKITIRKFDIEPSGDHLTQFYRIIHSIIQNENKIFICNLISNIGFHFFSMALAGSEILILDLIKACEIVLRISDDSFINANEVPKLEAISLLSSMLKLQELSATYKVFDPSMTTINIIDSGIFKNGIVNILINSAKTEPLLAPRILVIITISLHCYSELTSLEITTSDLNDVRHCILLLLSLMRFEELEVATIAVDMVRFLVNSSSQMQEKLPFIPDKIIQVLAWTINYNWIKYRKSINSRNRKFLTNAIFTLVDWTMNVPLSQLLESNDLHPKGLIFLTFCSLENVLKDNDNNIHTKVSMASVKQTQSDKKIIPENKRTPSATPIIQQANYNGLSIDPLNEYPYLFEVKPIKITIEVNVDNDQKLYEQVKLAARTALCHLINNIGQFPKNNVLGGLSSCVQEHHDFQVLKVKFLPDGSTENVICNDLSPEVFNSNDLQMFVVNGSMLVSFIALNFKHSKCINQSAPGGPPISKQISDSGTQESEVRLIIRDLCGKYCWDVVFVHKYENPNFMLKSSTDGQENMPPSPPPRRTLPSNFFMDKSSNTKLIKTEKPIIDHVDMLFQDLSQMNPEIFSCQSPKQNPGDSPQFNLESLSKRQILEQNTIENKLFDNHHCLKISHPKIIEKKLRSCVPYENPPDPMISNSKFYFCRQILTQLGFLSWKRRASIDLVQKSNIFRHLKTIDQRRGRETQKIAVIYIGWNQEDKESILGNTTGSLEFNTFISGLGWAVNLENHKGFMGGLEANGVNGCSAPYYANSTLEVMFHVSTWMPSEKPEDKPNKFKHLGNDEVMVIWSENYRDYRFNIMKTEFGDVMIIIYPLRNGLFGVSIKTKTEMKFFGPLFDGAIVNEKELPVLVRATAVNAGRKIRECKQHYQEFFVERADYLEKAIKKFCDPMSFEDFAENIYGIPVQNQDDSFQTTSSTEISPITNTSDNNKNPGFVVSELNSCLSSLDGNNKGTLRHSSSPKFNQLISADRSQYSFEENSVTRKQSKSYKSTK